jgi:hypothetical protein
VRRNLALLAGAAAGTVAAILLSRRSAGTTLDAPPPPAPPAPPAPDPRAEDLRRKLAEAREGAADEDDFEAAGMGAETVVEDSDVSAARKRVHDQARKTAEEMRKAGDDEA